jgi:hypothetical protein
VRCAMAHEPWSLFAHFLKEMTIKLEIIPRDMDQRSLIG